jgi:O-methyltransferase involved in polyketide biosynthesis
VNDKLSPPFDTTVPHSARVWNYWLGGKDHFPADREFGDRIVSVYPDIARAAREARAFLARAVAYLAGEVGIRQFLDIGTGLPTADNTHEVAQRIAPDSRVVYVDNDPLVLVHARALLVGTPDGATSYIEADVRDTDTILAAAAESFDVTKPVALMLLGVLGNVPDLGEAYATVGRLRAALPAGSYLVVQDGTQVMMSEADALALKALSDDIGYGYQLRTPEQIAHFLDGLELVEPGVVSSSLWRPEPNPDPPAEVNEFCGVGRKP